MKVESRPILPAGLEVPVGVAAGDEAAVEGRMAVLEGTCAEGGLTLQRYPVSEGYRRAAEHHLHQQDRQAESKNTQIKDRTADWFQQNKIQEWGRCQDRRGCKEEDLSHCGERRNSPPAMPP